MNILWVILSVLFLSLTNVMAAEAVGGARCFTMTPTSHFDDAKCSPVHVNIQFIDCKTSAMQERVVDAVARFECKRRHKILKYWYRNMMLFGELEKSGDSYDVARTRADVYGMGQKVDTAGAKVTGFQISSEPLEIPAPVSDEAKKKIDAIASGEAAPSPSPAPSPGPPPPFQESGVLLKGIKLSGLVDTYYTYNFNQPSPVGNPASAYGAAPKETVVYQPRTYHDQFTLNLATLGIERSSDPVGFRIDLGFGPHADYVAGANSDASTRNLLQAYFAYKTPFKLVIEAGKFYSFTGFEVPNTAANWNHSHSLLYYNTPTWFTGVRAMMPFGEVFKLGVYLVNGWNQLYETNRSKAAGAQAMISPVSWIDVVFNALGGNETSGGGDVRNLLEGIILISPIENLKVAADLVNVSESVNGGNNTQLSSTAIYARYSLGDFAVAPRYEIFNDGGTSFGLMWPGGQKITSTTVTLEYRAAENLRFQAEGRMDVSNAQPYLDSTGNLATTQNLATLAGVLSF